MCKTFCHIHFEVLNGRDVLCYIHFEVLDGRDVLCVKKRYIHN